MVSSFCGHAARPQADHGARHTRGSQRPSNDGDHKDRSFTDEFLRRVDGLRCESYSDPSLHKVSFRLVLGPQEMQRHVLLFYSDSLTGEADE